jgi:hypothetical protein
MIRSHLLFFFVVVVVVVDKRGQRSILTVVQFFYDQYDQYTLLFDLSTNQYDQYTLLFNLSTINTLNTTNTHCCSIFQCRWQRGTLHAFAVATDVGHSYSLAGRLGGGGE